MPKLGQTSHQGGRACQRHARDGPKFGQTGPQGEPTCLKLGRAAPQFGRPGRKFGKEGQLCARGGAAAQTEQAEVRAGRSVVGARGR